MLGSDIKMAVSAVRSVKWRSLLTVAGIAIGIVSVVTIASLGNGLKSQVNTQVKRSGSDLITVRPGQAVQRDKSGRITSVNLAYGYGFGLGSLSDSDLNAIKNTPEVDKSAPLSVIAGNMKTDESQMNDGFIIGTTKDLPDLLNQKIEYGSFFGDSESKQHLAVIGQRVAEQLFEQNVPIGRTFTLRGQDFVVRGIFSEFEENTLSLGADFNKAVFIPFGISSEINGGPGQIVEILAKPADPQKASRAAVAINKSLLAAHGEQSDFTVLSQAESLELNDKTLNTITGLVALVAAIALLVAGIGIMNIMLVSVTERTREIGIRKAIGATNRQLLSQFWIEAIALSLIGGLTGVIFSYFSNYLLRIFTNYKPVISLPIIIAASTVSVAVGVVFGMIPAYKAARKDPIEALRHEV